MNKYFNYVEVWGQYLMVNNEETSILYVKNTALNVYF